MTILIYLLVLKCDCSSYAIIKEIMREVYMEPAQFTLLDSPKQRYALATVSGSLGKAAAYAKYINPNAANPSQSAYRLEQTATMRRIMAQTTADWNANETIRKQRLNVTEQSLALLTKLLADSTDKSITEQLATLRIAKSLQSGLETAGDILKSGQQSSDLPTNTHDLTGIVI